MKRVELLSLVIAIGAIIISVLSFQHAKHIDARSEKVQLLERAHALDVELVGVRERIKLMVFTVNVWRQSLEEDTDVFFAEDLLVELEELELEIEEFRELVRLVPTTDDVLENTSRAREIALRVETLERKLLSTMNRAEKSEKANKRL